MCIYSEMRAVKMMEICYKLCYFNGIFSVHGFICRQFSHYDEIDEVDEIVQIFIILL